MPKLRRTVKKGEAVEYMLIDCDLSKSIAVNFCSRILFKIVLGDPLGYSLCFKVFIVALLSSNIDFFGREGGEGERLN